ncbi:Translation initiation factor eIF-2B subunit gamma [Ophiocordyceps camponoti-floridani]|uniref:Translation initiation factor eIF2B subunit gamma n=1 Tax=Ophiocordyceps camponoti-floridani TaxID=2030778 RepID=A0A8H4Q8Q5_9HYPO|nr:Translation initiation factor eIF-2B subunit gamma [Ophiocordyceps camponoti-floridani]
MPHAISMAAPGLQALILCGPGSSLATFTSDPDENLKALLPIANRPMVWYSIDFCLRMGVTAITLICPPSASAALTTAFNTNPFLTGLPLPRPDILAPVGLDQNTGTADILRLPQVRELVKTDFIVLPCDLVCEIAGEKLLQAWMVKAASLTEILGVGSLFNGSQTRHSGGLGVWFNTKTASSATPKVKGEETDLIATAPLPWTPTAAPKESVFTNLSRLVYSMPKDALKDVMEEQNTLPIRKSLLRKHPRVNDRLESIGEDVVGWLAKATWQTGLAEKLHLDALLREAGDDSGSTSGDAPTSLEASPTKEGRPKRWSLVRTVTAEVRQAQEKRDASKECQVPAVVAYVHPSEGSGSELLIRRVDTPQLLLATSLQLAKLPSTEEGGSSPFAHARKVAYPEGVKARTTITKQDSLIGDNVTVEEKTSIKETVVGANCQIQQGAKLWQCLLMEGVVIGKGCKLSKCILGRRCVIGEGSVLTDCEVQDNLLVEAGTEDKDNKLMSSNLEADVDEVAPEDGQEITAAADEAAR